MTTLTQIKAAVNKRLLETFQLKINAQDVEEGFERPSFSVELDNVSRVGLIDTIERSMTIRIYYFPSKLRPPATELLRVQEQLGAAFDTPVVVEGRPLPITDTNQEIVDGILQMEFELKFEEVRNEGEKLPMGTLYHEVN